MMSDRDRRGEAVETTQIGSTEGKSPGRQASPVTSTDTKLVETVAHAVRRGRFERTGRGKAYDPSLPLHETELEDARAALTAIQSEGSGSDDVFFVAAGPDGAHSRIVVGLPALKVAIGETIFGVSGPDAGNEEHVEEHEQRWARIIDQDSGDPIALLQESFEDGWLSVYRVTERLPFALSAKPIPSQLCERLREALINLLAIARIKYGNMDAGANIVFEQAELALLDALEAPKVSGEREAVVAWLQTHPFKLARGDWFAKAIERGEHHPPAVDSQ